MNTSAGLPIIHIGFPRTATTTLQFHLFNKHSEIQYIGQHPSWQHDLENPIKQMCFQIETYDSIDFDLSACRKIHREKVAPLIGQSKRVLLSRECFSIGNSLVDRRLLAERLSNIFGPSQIIIVIRNQREILRSVYLKNAWRSNTNLTNGYRIPPNLEGKNVRVSDWLEYVWAMKDNGILSNYKYYELIRVYEDIFGKENVFLGVFEEFLKDKKSFVKQLCRFTNINQNEGLNLMQDAWENRSPDANQHRYRRFQNLLDRRLGRLPFTRNLFLKVYKFLVKGSNRKFDIPEHWEMRLKDYYRRSNSMLKREYIPQLLHYEYPV
jgi:hypothetical protein